jgi:hypothetical protein
MARKGNPISVRLDLNCNSDSSRLSRALLLVGILLLRLVLPYLAYRLWNWKGATLFLAFSNWVEWVLPVIGDLTLFVGDGGAGSSKRPPLDLNAHPTPEPYPDLEGENLRLRQAEEDPGDPHDIQSSLDRVGQPDTGDGTESKEEILRLRAENSRLLKENSVLRNVLRQGYLIRRAKEKLEKADGLIRRASRLEKSNKGLRRRIMEKLFGEKKDDDP